MARVSKFGEMYPVFHKIPTPIAHTKFVIYSINPHEHYDDWDALKKEKVRIDFVRGNAQINNIQQSLGKEITFYPVNSIEAGMERLLLKRSNLFFISEHQGKGWLLRNPKKAANIFPVGVLGDVDAFTYLSPANKKLKEPITRILSNLKSEGLLDSLEKNAQKIWINVKAKDTE